MKILKTEPVIFTRSYVEVFTTGPILDLFYKFQTEEQQVFLVFIDNDELTKKKFGLFFINAKNDQEIDITNSLDDNFKFFKTIQIEGNGDTIYVFIREFQEDVTK